MRWLFGRRMEAKDGVVLAASFLPLVVLGSGERTDVLLIAASAALALGTTRAALRGFRLLAAVLAVVACLLLVIGAIWTFPPVAAVGVGVIGSAMAMWILLTRVRTLLRNPGSRRVRHEDDEPPGGWSTEGPFVP